MTPTLISAFLTYTLITALTPGPNNILALSSVTSMVCRTQLRVLAGMSVGLYYHFMLICAALTFSLVETRLTLYPWYWDGLARRTSCGWPGRLPKANRRQGRWSVEPGRLFGRVWG